MGIRAASAGFVVLLHFVAGAQGEQTASFEQTVAPVLLRSCVECHSGADPEGGLDLTSAGGLKRGGESGAVLDGEHPSAGLLYRKIADGEMPPEEELSAADREALLRWISTGAEWAADGRLDLFQLTTSKRAGYDWWALQPIQRPPVPAAGGSWRRNPIDAFVLAKLSERGLQPSPEADRRELIRRVSFDLLGLPPTPKETRQFLHDARPDAYERLVDRLLASPDYGVRWGRHWLDLARFGESQGFERDRLRDNAWPYRDWVIDALNADMPYDEFAKRQIAGDVLPDAKERDAVATGFLVAGPWDEVGQQQQSAAMKLFVRQDEIEDYVSVIGQTFLGLTIHCARCHDHKFDPIRQEEYYRLAAAVAGVHHGSRELWNERDRQRQEQLAERIGQTSAKLALLEQTVRERVLTARSISSNADAPTPIARWTFDHDYEDSLGPLDGRARRGARLADGALVLDGQQAFVATAPLNRPLLEKTLEAWVQLESLDQRGGGVVSLETLGGNVFDAIVFGEREPRRWMAGSDNFVRTQSFSAPEEDAAVDRIVHVAITYAADGTITCYRDGRPYGTPYRTQSPIAFEAGRARVLFGLRHSPAADSKLLSGRIDAAQLYDRALTEAEIATSAELGPRGVSEEQLLSACTDDERAERDVLANRLKALQQQHDALQPLSAYVVDAQEPHATSLLLRGSPLTPGQSVDAGGIAAVRGVACDFGLPSEAPDAARRRALAGWIASPGNPLFARVIVNRLWLHHFGGGLIATPSDFGFNGGLPSHPELLDWLADELRRRDMSLKEMHRLMVTSATYRQSSRTRDEAAAIDADNRWLWRMSPRRLEAEALRDAMLSVAGQLNREMGGPGYRDFETYVSNSQFYTVIDPVGPEFQRRTIYRTCIRSARSPLLDVFDCPDPSTKTPERAVTVTPLQALSLLNNSFVLRVSGQFADRVRLEAGDNAGEQVERALALAYGRQATDDERTLYAGFVVQHGLAEFCRVVFNSSEFVYVD